MAPAVRRPQGRRLFGRDPREYDRARPGYPPELYRTLRDRCGLVPGTRVFEIGAGTGKATRELLRRGASPLTAIEPDARLARFLGSELARWRHQLDVLVVPFEEVQLERGSYDLGVAAASFHWLSERRSLRHVARLLRVGGWWAAWSNLHGDPTRPTEFTRAADPLYAKFEARGVAGNPGERGFAAYRRDRLAALRRAGSFRRLGFDTIRWKLTLTTEKLVALNRTFSTVAVLPRLRRERLLADLARLVDEEFHGRVTIRMITTLVTAQRAP